MIPSTREEGDWLYGTCNVPIGRLKWKSTPSCRSRVTHHGCGTTSGAREPKRNTHRCPMGDSSSTEIRSFATRMARSDRPYGQSDRHRWHAVFAGAHAG